MKRCPDCKRLLEKGFASKHGTVKLPSGAFKRRICKWCHAKRWKAFIASIDPDDE